MDGKLTMSANFTNLEISVHVSSRAVWFGEWKAVVPARSSSQPGLRIFLSRQIRNCGKRHDCRIIVMQLFDTRARGRDLET